MRPLRAPFPVIHIHQLLTDRFVEGGGTDVGVGELVGFGAGAEPHFGNVKVEGFAGGGEEGFDGGDGGGEEAGLVECLEGFVGLIMGWWWWGLVGLLLGGLGRVLLLLR